MLHQRLYFTIIPDVMLCYGGVSKTSQSRDEIWRGGRGVIHCIDLQSGLERNQPQLHFSLLHNMLCVLDLNELMVVLLDRFLSEILNFICLREAMSISLNIQINNLVNIPRSRSYEFCHQLNSDL